MSRFAKSVIVLCLLLLPASAFSQRSRQVKPATTTTQTRAAGAAEVGDKIKILTKFLYLYGGISRDVLSVEAGVRRGDASQTAIDSAARSKKSISDNLNNVRDGLDQLEISFRTTPALQPYYMKLAGAAAGAAEASDLASAGQYDRSGRALLDVVNRLTDVLVAMQ